MYNFLSASGSRFREIVGSASYDEHWSDMMGALQQESASGQLMDLSGSQLITAESELVNWEANPVSASAWFDDLINQNQGGF